MSGARGTPVVQTFEYGRVPLPAPFDNSHIRDRLVDAGQRAGMSVFEIRRRRLYAKGIVGVVDIGSVAVEIFPKTQADASHAQAQQFLFDLLRFTGRANVVSTTNASVAAGANSTLEVFLDWAVTEVIENISYGIPKRYQRREERSHSVRGRIDLTRAARAHPGKELDLVVRYASLDENNAISQIIRWLLRWIEGKTRVSVTSMRARLLLRTAFASIGDISLGPEHFEKADLFPIESHWNSVMLFARSIAEQDFLNPLRVGSVQSVTILFGLHDLFESALRKVFLERLPRMGISMRARPAKLLQPLPADGRLPMLQLKPDFRFEIMGTSSCTVADAKWKMILDQLGSVHLVEADAYQLSTYISALEASAGILFCPAPVECPSVWTSGWTFKGTNKPIQIIGTHLPSLVSRHGELVRNELCQRVAAVIHSAANSAVSVPSL